MYPLALPCVLPCPAQLALVLLQKLLHIKEIHPAFAVCGTTITHHPFAFMLSKHFLMPFKKCQQITTRV